MREAFDELWIIDLGGDNLGARKTPNVFNIQTPVAIAIGVRYGAPQPTAPARVHYARLDADTREEKLAKVSGIGAFAALTWQDGFGGWMQPFLPQGQGAYYDWPLLTDVFPWQGVGCKFERTWPVGETEEVLSRRWSRLLSATAQEKPKLFREDDDRKVAKQYFALNGSRVRVTAIDALPANAPSEPFKHYGFRSFDRQWAIADNRIGGRMNPALWLAAGCRQVHLCSLLTGVIGLGPAATVAAQIPDIHHFRGSFGGKDVIPLWRDAEATQANLTAGLLELLSKNYRAPVSPEDLFAYAYALLATPRYVERFSEELTVPGPRLPLSRDVDLFAATVTVGRELIHLHTFGERFVPAGGKLGQVPKGRANLDIGIPDTPAAYPEDFDYDAAAGTLRVGSGLVAGVDREVFEFSVSGLQVVRSWLAYRMKSGAGKKSSPLDDIRPERWTVQMSQELLQLLWVLEHTLARHAALSDLLERIVAGPLFTSTELPAPDESQRKPPGRADEDDAPTQHALL